MRTDDPYITMTVKKKQKWKIKELAAKSKKSITEYLDDLIQNGEKKFNEPQENVERHFKRINKHFGKIL